MMRIPYSFFQTAALSAVLFLLSTAPVYAHEGESEITDVAAADWVGPAAAVLVLALFWLAARLVRRRAKRRGNTKS